MTFNLEEIVEHFNLDVSKFSSLCINSGATGDLSTISTNKKLRNELKENDGLLLYTRKREIETDFGMILPLRILPDIIFSEYEFTRVQLDFFDSAIIKGYKALGLKDLTKATLLSKGESNHRGTRCMAQLYYPSSLFVPFN